MEYKTLGATGVEVSALCLGTMQLGAWGNTDEGSCNEVIHAALDAGINFIDTADTYSDGQSETIVGAALRGRRDSVVLATKIRRPVAGALNVGGNSRRWIVQSCEASLRRLQTDYIDLYQVHRPDPSCDIDQTLSALSDLVRAGKIRYAGTSTFPASQIVEAQWCADRRGWERFVSEQPPYSMLVRGAESDVMPTCQRHGIAVVTWAPLASGWLSGRWRSSSSDLTSGRTSLTPERFDLSDPANQRKLAAADALAGLAEELGVSLAELSIGWVLAHPAVTAAIIGPRTLDHLPGLLSGVDVRLDNKVLEAVDRIVPPGLNFSWADAGYVPPGMYRASAA